MGYRNHAVALINGDNQMRDIRIVHDRCGVYADWIGIVPYDPNGVNMHDYLIGKSPPHYPLPTTIGRAFIFDDYVCLMPANASWKTLLALFECWRDD